MTRAGPPFALGLAAGEDALAVRLDGERLHVISPRAFAPGTPVRGELALENGPLVVEGKAQGSKRREDARFDVVLRLVNLTRVARETLVAAFAGGR